MRLLLNHQKKYRFHELQMHNIKDCILQVGPKANWLSVSWWSWSADFTSRVEWAPQRFLNRQLWKYIMKKKISNRKYDWTMKKENYHYHFCLNFFCCYDPQIHDYDLTNTLLRPLLFKWLWLHFLIYCYDPPLRHSTNTFQSFMSSFVAAATFTSFNQ